VSIAAARTMLGISIILVDGISADSPTRIPEQTPGPSLDVNVVAERGQDPVPLQTFDNIAQMPLSKYCEYAPSQILHVGRKLWGGGNVRM
jgi:hypothetical protein